MLDTWTVSVVGYKYKYSVHLLNSLVVSNIHQFKEGTKEKFTKELQIQFDSDYSVT